MEYANIIYTVDNGIATIKLNRPKALNALNSEINADIMAAINEVKADPSVRVLIMTGSERAFAAGADVKEMPVSSAVWQLRSTTFSSPCPFPPSLPLAALHLAAAAR